MKNRKTYIIADFVKILDVPRTTLKDWLVRYDQYIESETRGHRKIYFDSSLKVLEEIKDMRKDDGFSAEEIMSELSKRHPVNPDIHDGEEEIPKVSNPQKVNPELTPEETLPVHKRPSSLEGLVMTIKQQNEQLEQMLVEKLHNAASDIHEAQIAALLPIVKRQHEKIERILTGKFQDMASNLHQTQLDANNIFKQQSRRTLLVIALVFTAIIAVVLTSSNIFYMLKDQKEKLNYAQIKLGENIDRNNNFLVIQANKRQLAEKQQQSSLKKISKKIDNDNQTFHKDMKALKEGLAEQRKLMDASIKEYKRTLLEQQQRDMKNLKEVLASERKALLSKVEKIEATDDKIAVETAIKKAEKEALAVQKLKDELEELRTKMKKMKQEKEKAEKSRIPVMIFPGAKPPVGKGQ